MKQKQKNNFKKIFAAKTFGQKMADSASQTIGSWTFIATQTVFVVAWIILNAVGYYNRWDPYPFILLSLALNIIAIYTAPVILMTQNREAERDRRRMIKDLETDRRVERRIIKLAEAVEKIEKKIDK